jgi:hypothetical protein
MPVTWRAVGTGGDTAGTSDRTASLACLADDLLIVYYCVSGVVAAPTLTDDQGGTYLQLEAGAFDSSNGFLLAYVRNEGVASDATITVTAAGSNTAGVLHIHAWEGSTVYGAAAIRQSAFVELQASGTTPTVVFDAVCLTANATIGGVGSRDTTTEPPADWTERADTNVATPGTCCETVTRDSGFTGDTITWGAAQGSSVTYAAIAIEIADTPPPTTLTPASERIRFQEAAPSLVMSLALAPASERMRFQEGTVDLVMALTLSPSSQQLRYQQGAAGLTLGALVALPASQRVRFQDGTASLALSLVVTPAAERIRYQSTAPAIELGPVVLIPSSGRIRYRTGAVVGAAPDAIYDTTVAMRIVVNTVAPRITSNTVAVRRP